MTGPSRYTTNIPVADNRFDAHQAKVDAQRKTTKEKGRRSKGKGPR
jgi:hypothetical protein